MIDQCGDSKIKDSFQLLPDGEQQLLTARLNLKSVRGVAHIIVAVRMILDDAPPTRVLYNDPL